MSELEGNKLKVLGNNVGLLLSCRKSHNQLLNLINEEL